MKNADKLKRIAKGHKEKRERKKDDTMKVYRQRIKKLKSNLKTLTAFEESIKGIDDFVWEDFRVSQGYLVREDNPVSISTNEIRRLFATTEIGKDLSSSSYFANYCIIAQLMVDNLEDLTTYILEQFGE